MARRPSAAVVLVGIVAVLAAIASAAGVLLRGDLGTTAFTTVRGEALDVVTGGVYAWNSLPVVSEGVGWDLVTLLLVVPAALIVLPFFARGSLRAALVELGLLAYFLYQYAEYSMFWAVGPLYPLHLATFALALTAMALLVAGLDLATLPARFGSTFPRRGVVALGLFMIVLLCGLWLPTIVRVVVDGDVQGQLNGGVTLVVPAFDLGLLVPLGAFTAATVWRRLPVGFVLASVVVVKAVAMPIAIIAMLLVEAVNTGTLALPPIIIFALTALASAFIGARVYGAIDAPPADALMAHPRAVGA
jgi:hypothetical protein